MERFVYFVSWEILDRNNTRISVGECQLFVNQLLTLDDVRQRIIDETNKDWTSKGLASKVEDYIVHLTAFNTLPH